MQLWYLSSIPCCISLLPTKPEMKKEESAETDLQCHFSSGRGTRVKTVHPGLGVIGLRAPSPRERREPLMLSQNLP